jgi:hypothetical protein
MFREPWTTSPASSLGSPLRGFCDEGVAPRRRRMRKTPRTVRQMSVRPPITPPTMGPMGVDFCSEGLGGEVEGDVDGDGDVDCDDDEPD